MRKCLIPTRYAGTCNYSLRHSLRLALDGVVSFSTRPLLLSAAFGALVTFVAFAVMVWLTIEKLVNLESVLPGTTTVIVAVLFMGGIQLVTIGVLGTYWGKVFYETKKRPLYVTAERLGFADEEPPPADPAGTGED